MNRWLLVVLFSSLFFTCSNTATKKRRTHREELETYFNTLHTLKKLNGVLYVMEQGKVLMCEAYNLNNDPQSSTFVSTESQFDIHSISKLMARYIVEKFELEGKLEKSNTLLSFIPDFPNGDKITLGMLLNHSSGLPRSFEETQKTAISLNSKEILDLAKQQELQFSPGSAKQYSNIAYEIVYYILEQIAQKPFAQIVQDELFTPLQMTNSGAHFFGNSLNLHQWAKNHEKDDENILRVPNINDDELKTARLFSTSHDLHKFLTHLKESPIASLLQNEQAIIEKSGGSDGIRAEVYLDLKNDFHFILLANYDAIPFQKTVADIANILNDQEYTLPQVVTRKAIVLSEQQLAPYTGSYVFPDMGNLILVISSDKKRLILSQEGTQIASLKAESETVFFDDPTEAESFEFIENSEGSFDVLMGWKGVQLKGIRIEK